MQKMGDIPLPGTPAEIQSDSGQLLISFPILKCIKYYNAASLALEKTLDLPEAVSSFVFWNGFLFYTEDDQFCRIFRLQLSTGETAYVGGKDGRTFHCPKILVNEKAHLLYVMESSLTSGSVVYYDLSSLVIKSESSGCANSTRIAYFDDNRLYVYNHSIDPLNAEKIYDVFDYGQRSEWNGMFCVSKNHIITNMAVYDRNTRQPIFLLGSEISRAIETPSGIMLFFDFLDTVLYVVPPC